jgi:hypothetical protein
LRVCDVHECGETVPGHWVQNSDRISTENRLNQAHAISASTITMGKFCNVM